MVTLNPAEAPHELCVETINSYRDGTLAETPHQLFVFVAPACPRWRLREQHQSLLETNSPLRIRIDDPPEICR